MLVLKGGCNYLQHEDCLIAIQRTHAEPYTNGTYNYSVRLYEKNLDVQDRHCDDWEWDLESASTFHTYSAICYNIFQHWTFQQFFDVCSRCHEYHSQESLTEVRKSSAITEMVWRVYVRYCHRTGINNSLKETAEIIE